MITENVTTVSPSLKKLQIEADKGRYDLITTNDLWGLYQKDPKLLLVDVRESSAYQDSHIKGAINFPMKPTW